MSGEFRIRELIDSGRIPPEEGQRLLEALHSAESQDRILREELREIEAAKRSSRRWTLAAVGLAAIAALALLVVVVGPGPLTSADQDARISAQLASQDLDVAIAQLEQRLRQPGTASDYRTLSVAYYMRYQQSGDESDRLRAVEAGARADQMQRRFSMQGRSGVFGLLFVLIILTTVILGIALMYNGLTTRDERVEERWAQVEAVLQRRLDLVPALVETVRGYANHERDTLTAVTEARVKALGALESAQGASPRDPQMAQTVTSAQDQLSSALGRLLAIAEQYPDLRASASFVTLQSQLEGTENRIAVERQRYNTSVRDYNSRLRAFPSNVVGAMFGYEGREYFESASGADRAVPVEF
jgi:LemA protein